MPLQPPLHILRLPSASLPDYPRLDALIALINAAFVTSWHTVDGLVGPNATRYESSKQFTEEMGDSGVTWVAIEGEEGGEGEGRIVASAGYKKFEKVWKVLEMMENGLEGVESTRVGQDGEEEDAEAESERFELVVVVVDPSLQKSGLASRVCGAVETELKEKALAMGKKHLRMMIRTGKENNETYWTRKGYRVLRETRFPPGNFGSKTGFAVLDMERVIEL